MVKGLDYALLAQRKAELQREQEVERDEELDAMMDDLGSKAGPSSSKEKEDKKSKQPEEKLGKGVRLLHLVVMGHTDRSVQIYRKSKG